MGEEQLVQPEMLAVILASDQGSCESIVQVHAERYRGREVFVVWPPWAMGRPT